jgi:hypothetical protein
MFNVYLQLFNWGDGLTPSNDGNYHPSVYLWQYAVPQEPRLLVDL